MTATVELDLYIHMRDRSGRVRAIRVSKDGIYRETGENPFLPTSQITIVSEPNRGPARIRMPRWLAEKKGLV